tara:strand:+ start:1095 stop:1355 length:261 start_codon:yes stop_codon:yes gene_type:complete
MKDNLDKLNELNPNYKKDLGRHKQLEKRIADVVKVTKDPDKWNANIASRDRVDSMEDVITELREEIKRLNGRIDGLNYLIKQIIKT